MRYCGLIIAIIVGLAACSSAEPGRVGPFTDPGEAGFYLPPFPIAGSAQDRLAAVETATEFKTGSVHVDDSSDGSQLVQVDSERIGFEVIFDPANDSYTVQQYFQLGPEPGDPPVVEFLETDGAQPDGTVYQTNASQSLAQPGMGISVLPNAVSIRRNKDGEADSLLVFLRPGEGADRFTHATMGYWERAADADLGTPSGIEYFVFGFYTDPADRPDTGTAVYTGVAAATYDGPTKQLLSGTGDFTVDFRFGQLETEIEFVDAVSLEAAGSLHGAGALSANSHSFLGDAFANMAGGELSGPFTGGFFGQNAEEAGFVFGLEEVDMPSHRLVGGFLGRRN